MYKLQKGGGITRLSDDAGIPNDPNNTDWKEYQQWRSEGNTPEPEFTPEETVDKWVAGGRAAAVVSGAYCLSSNQQGVASDKKTHLGGVGWITEPEGKVLGKNSKQEPFLTIEIDIKFAEKSKTTYPRYVKE